MSIGLRRFHESPAPTLKADLSFVYEQASRYVRARPWERLGPASLYLDLKVGSWQEVCAQHFSNGPVSALFVFPGRRNMLDLQKAGMAEPPAGTIFVELRDGGDSPETFAAVREYGWPPDLRPIPAFQAISSDGWLPLERSHTRLLALAFAAITDLDAASEGGPEIAGELAMPGATRGRYRARRAPTEDQESVPIMGMPRFDLFGDGDYVVSFTATPSSEYDALRASAGFCRSAERPSKGARELIPLVTISGSPDQVAETVQKLKAAEPLGIAFGEMDGVLSAILVGRNDTYVLVEAQEQREELMLWQHTLRSSGGMYALAVNRADFDQHSGEPTAEAVEAIFECGSAPD
jgi:hypothetical protein